MPPRKKADLYNIVQRIIHLYVDQKKHVREIEGILRAEGYDISKSSIHRTIKNYQDAAKELIEFEKEVKTLIETFKDKPATDYLEAGAKMLSGKLFKIVSQIIDMDFDDPEKLINSISKLSNTVEKLQRYREERLKKAMQEVENSEKQSWTKDEVIKLLREAYEG